ncbi:NAD(P)H-binding protein [Campylobacter mucosalis]|uniref:NAD(P)H-binding protein n=1 Tax=Campylobacter mucosalis TaxID=202 RepID=UPI00325B7948
MNGQKLVVGASSIVGREIVSEFLDDKDCDKIVTWVRKASGAKNQKLREKVINFDEILSLENERFDAVFCALGTTIKQARSVENFKKADVIYPINLAKWAKRSGCENFTLISAPKANINSKFLYLRAKGEAEQDVKEQGFKSLSIIHPPLKKAIELIKDTAKNL